MSAIGRIALSYTPTRYMVGQALLAVEKEFDKVGTAAVSTIESGVGLAVGAVTGTARVGANAVGSIIDCWV